MCNLQFTVVTVCYNAEKSIEKTIQSVLDQVYSPYEYLIIDGASKDRTVEVAEKYKTQFKNKGIEYVIKSEKDSGIYNAMNKGIMAATGDFVSFLNAGDWYEPDALLKINKFYEKETFDLTYGGLHYINPNGTVTNKMSKLDIFPITSRHWNHPSMFLRNEIYKKYGFDEKYKTYADFHLYTKLRKTDIKIRIIPEIITNFPADGVSTDVKLRNVLARGREKYRIYRDNGYGRIYWLESYGWEIMKSVYFRMKS